MTNADKIRNMTNEELADLISDCDCTEYCVYGHMIDCSEMSCKDGILEWLEKGSERMTDEKAMLKLEFLRGALLGGKRLEIVSNKENIEMVDKAMEALEKQIPKKPILKHDVSVTHINRGNQPHEWKRLESDNWHCPECDRFVGERVYVCSKVHDQMKKKYCGNCGQKLDWSDKG